MAMTPFKNSIRFLNYIGSGFEKQAGVCFYCSGSAFHGSIEAIAVDNNIVFGGN